MASISGVHSEDGVPIIGYKVTCYDYGANTIANLTALVDSQTTAADGSYTLTTLNTNQHVVRIVDPNDVKQGVVFLATPV